MYLSHVFYLDNFIWFFFPTQKRMGILLFVIANLAKILIWWL